MTTKPSVLTPAFFSLVAQRQSNAEVFKPDLVKFALINHDGTKPSTAGDDTPPIIFVDQVGTTKAKINDNELVVSFLLDSSQGDYEYDWIGYYDVHNSVETLVAYIHVPKTEKIKNDEGTVGNNIVNNYIFTYQAITAIANVTVPAATWQIDFNARLNSIEEDHRNNMFSLFGHSFFLNNCFKPSTSDNTTLDIANGCGYVFGLDLNNATVIQDTLPSTTGSYKIYIDAKKEGHFNSTAIFVQIKFASTLPANYTDANNINHYIAEVGELTVGSSTIAVTDTRAKVITYQDQHGIYDNLIEKTAISHATDSTSQTNVASSKAIKDASDALDNAKIDKTSISNAVDSTSIKNVASSKAVNDLRVLVNEAKNYLLEQNPIQILHQYDNRLDAITSGWLLLNGENTNLVSEVSATQNARIHILVTGYFSSIFTTYVQNSIITTINADKHFARAKAGLAGGSLEADQIFEHQHTNTGARQANAANLSAERNVSGAGTGYGQPNVLTGGVLQTSDVHAGNENRPKTIITGNYWGIWIGL